MEDIIYLLPENWQAIGVLLVPVICSVISIFVPSGSKFMQVVDVLQGAVGKNSNGDQREPAEE